MRYGRMRCARHARRPENYRPETLKWLRLNMQTAQRSEVARLHIRSYRNAAKGWDYFFQALGLNVDTLPHSLRTGTALEAG